MNHPFAKYVRIIARGPTLSRPLTEDEMIDATRMILRDEVDPLQLGAFLCVLRVRTEDPGEGAGFVRAVKEVISVPENAPAVDLDWSSYAGKKRHLPWFLLSALLLARNGVKVFMHGTEGHTEGRIYAREALGLLGIAPAQSMEEAAQQIIDKSFAFMPLQAISPRLQTIMEMKPILGVRTPINTFARMINPFNAAHTIQAIFHPNYTEIHRETSALLGQPNIAVFKGDSGEAEHRPHKPLTVMRIQNGEKLDEAWPPLLDAKIPKETDTNPDRLMKVWKGEDEDPIAIATVQGTAAIALRLLGRADTPQEAYALAKLLWENRPESPL